MANLYRKRGIATEAVQWTGSNQLDIQAWGAACYEIDPEDREDDPDGTLELWVAANGRWLVLHTGDWVLRDEAGYYPCRADIFARTYEPWPGEGET